MRPFFCSVVVLLLFLISCQKQDMEIIRYSQSDNNTNFLHQQATFIKTHPNPYSIGIMRQALERVEPKTKAVYSSLKPTHIYVRFEPTNHQEFKSVYLDKALMTFPFPLDQRITSGWIGLIEDAEYSTNGYQHRWGYVPLEKDLTKIACPHTVLDTLCFPKGLIFSELDSGDDNDSMSMLEKEAMNLCGISFSEVDNNVERSITGDRSVYPSGRITYRDSSLHAYKGCEGLFVTVFKAFPPKVSSAVCDADGYFSCDKAFSGSWYYIISFSRADYQIRIDESTVEPMLVVHSGSELNLQFKTCNPSDTNDLDRVFYCEVAKAAARYYYGNIDGLIRPPMKEDLEDKLYIYAYRGRDSINNYNGFFLGLSDYPYIRVFRDNGSSRCTSQKIFSTTIHELTHAVHYNELGVTQYQQRPSILKESLTTGVEWYLSKKLYPGVLQYLGYNNVYTGIIKDLIDDDGYTTHHLPVSETITNHDIVNLEQVFINATTWEEAQYNTGLFTPRKDIEAMDMLFNYWSSVPETLWGVYHY